MKKTELFIGILFLTLIIGCNKDKEPLVLLDPEVDIQFTRIDEHDRFSFMVTVNSNPSSNYTDLLKEGISCSISGSVTATDLSGNVEDVASHGVNDQGLTSDKFILTKEFEIWEGNPELSDYHIINVQGTVTCMDNQFDFFKRELITGNNLQNKGALNGNIKLDKDQLDALGGSNGDEFKVKIILNAETYYLEFKKSGSSYNLEYENIDNYTTWTSEDNKYIIYNITILNVEPGNVNILFGLNEGYPAMPNIPNGSVETIVDIETGLTASFGSINVPNDF